MVQKNLEICLSDPSFGKPRNVNEGSFTARKGDNGKGKEVIKMAHKTKGKEAPLCCIDGLPPHSQV